MDEKELGLAVINRLLDEAKAITGSDRQTALRCGFQSSFIAKLRKGGASVPTETAVRLALILKQPWPALLAEIEGAQARTVKSKDFWGQVTAGVVSVSFAFLLAANEIPAILSRSVVIESTQSPSLLTDDRLSIMRSEGRRKKGGFGRFGKAPTTRRRRTKPKQRYWRFG